MAKVLKFKTHEVITLDNDGDEQESEITYAVVDKDTAGQEVALRNGTSRILVAGDVVVPADANRYDVFTAKEWQDTWSDSERVADAGEAGKVSRPQDAAKKTASSGQRN